MDPTRGGFERQKSLNSPGEIPSPTMLPLHRHACSSSFGPSNVKKPLNLQAKAAAQRLAQVMAYQPADYKDDNEDDFSLEYGSMGLGLVATGRSIRPHSSVSIGIAERPPSAHSASVIRSSPAANPLAQAPSNRSTMPINPLEQPLLERSLKFFHPLEQTPSGQSPMSIHPLELPPSRRSPMSIHPQEQHLFGRSTLPINHPEQPPYARSITSGDPILGIKAVAMVPPAVTMSLKPQIPENLAGVGAGAGVLGESRKDKRLSTDSGSMNSGESTELSAQLSSTALQVELDMLQ